jgi:hypothetical protein
LRAAFNQVFAWFDPLAPENAEDANMRALGDEVADKPRSKVGDQIDILNVIVPLVNYDQATQDRMNALNVEKPNTRLTGQRAQTTTAEARSNEILAASVSNDPTCWPANAWTRRGKAEIGPLGCWPTTFATSMCWPNQLTAFDARYNTAARPFDWHFNPSDLNRLLHESPYNPRRTHGRDH